MCSEKQLEANRQNASKSTGPKTPEGKAKSSQNAVTHGLTSKRPVLDIEDTEEFHQFTGQWLGQLAPSNPLELYFAQRAASHAWRIQRAQCYETLILNTLIKNCHSERSEESLCDSQSAQEAPQIENADALLGRILTDDFRTHRTLDKISRYEMRLETSMLRCFDTFQKIRQGKILNSPGLPKDFQTASKVTEASCGTAAPGCDQSVQNEPNIFDSDLKSNIENRKSSMPDHLAMPENVLQGPDPLTQIMMKMDRDRQTFKKAV